MVHQQAGLLATNTNDLLTFYTQAASALNMSSAMLLRCYQDTTHVNIDVCSTKLRQISPPGTAEQLHSGCAIMADDASRAIAYS